MERSKDLQSYYDIGDAKATEKTSQALREGQPKLRKKMIDHGIITNDIHTCSTEHILSLLPPATINRIDPNLVFIGDDSYSSMNRNDMSSSSFTNQQRSMPEQSLNHACVDMQPRPIMDDRLTIGDCRFHPTPNGQFEQPKNTIVTPPVTPPNPPQQLVEKTKFENNAFTCPFPDMGMDTTDFDDSNSIMTFDMDDEEMINEDDAQSSFSASTPSASQTNHFRALNELKGNIPMYDGCDRQTFSAVPRNTSPTLNHLRALTELKDQVPIHPSSASNNDCQNLGFHNSNQFNGNVSQSNLNGSSTSIGFVPNQTLRMQVNFFKKIIK